MAQVRAAAYDYQYHFIVLRDALAKPCDPALWAANWEIYEGMRWLLAIEHGGLHINVTDIDYDRIWALVGRYRKWAAIVGWKDDDGA